MSELREPGPGSAHHGFQPRQAIMFLGENATPENPGYVTIVGTVLERFHPELQLRLISAGARNQTAAGVRSRALMDLLVSSHPDWLVLALGTAEAIREPLSAQLLAADAERRHGADPGLDAAFGPEMTIGGPDESAPLDRLAPQSELLNLGSFAADLRAVLDEIAAAGIRPILMTPAAPFMDFPLLPVFRSYSQAVRALGEEAGIPVVDLERAFLDMIDRAANYKQRVVLAEANGTLNRNGQTLVARTFLRSMRLIS